MAVMKRLIKAVQMASEIQMLYTRNLVSLQQHHHAHEAYLAASAPECAAKELIDIANVSALIDPSFNEIPLLKQAQQTLESIDEDNYKKEGYTKNAKGDYQRLNIPNDRRSNITIQLRRLATHIPQRNLTRALVVMVKLNLCTMVHIQSAVFSICLTLVPEVLFIPSVVLNNGTYPMADDYITLLNEIFQTCLFPSSVPFTDDPVSYLEYHTSPTGETQSNIFIILLLDDPLLWSMTDQMKSQCSSSGFCSNYKLIRVQYGSHGWTDVAQTLQS
ncbi:hypothetical protein C8J56DRAFT_904104 [Mycena floridula]|nr:hypothetical protein C8J56DRAFT_904104 [Mycena floridula]